MLDFGPQLQKLRGIYTVTKIINDEGREGRINFELKSVSSLKMPYIHFTNTCSGNLDKGSDE